MKTDWRFLDTGACSGAYNMALDEAILNEKDKNPSLPPTLRIFCWEPACLSIGRNQNLEEINLEKCRELGIDVVRRPTGGTAILHDEELTYSIVISSEDGLPRSVRESFAVLNQGLIAAYKNLGVEADLIPNEERNFVPLCFASAGIADLTHKGKKIVGSAQRKIKNAVLQHGSLVIKHNPRLMLELFNLDTSQKENLLEDFLKKTTDLASIRPNTNWYELKMALIKGFHEALGVEFKHNYLDDEGELREALNLIPKYMRLERENASA